jgi:hypothetical protein
MYNNYHGSMLPKSASHPAKSNKPAINWPLKQKNDCKQKKKKIHVAPANCLDGNKIVRKNGNKSWQHNKMICSPRDADCNAQEDNLYEDGTDNANSIFSVWFHIVLTLDVEAPPRRTPIPKKMLTGGCLA